MPLSYKLSHVTESGRMVGFNVAHRKNEPTYFVYFRGPTGKRLERDTNETGKERAKRAAVAIIEEEYEPNPDGPAETVTWGEAEERMLKRMTAAGIRDSSRKFYAKKLRAVRSYYAPTTGPADISPGMARTFADHLITSEGRGSKKRSPYTVKATITALSALWSKWLVEELGICTGNPWADVTPPKVDKPTVKTLDDEQVEHFHGWLAARFPGWELPAVFFRVKELTGCRLSDLCSLRADQHRGGRLRFDPGQTKGRAVPLPADLDEAIGRVKGRRYLWDRYPVELRAALKAKGWPAHQLKGDFDPSRMVGWVCTLFADYNADHPDRPKVTSHLFRKRAFTVAYRAGIPLDDAAVAFGCGVDTIKGHYLGVTEEEITDNVFARLPQRTAGKPG